VHAGDVGVRGRHRLEGGALLGDPGHGEPVDAALLALLDHHAAGHQLAVADREGEPALLVETQGVVADEHRITPNICPPVAVRGTIRGPCLPIARHSNPLAPTGHHFVSCRPLGPTAPHPRRHRGPRCGGPLPPRGPDQHVPWVG
jgi:hypothetical protein